MISAESSPWVQIAVAVIGVTGLVLVEMLRRVKTDSDKNARQQTKDHDTVIELLRDSIINDKRMEGSIDRIEVDTHETRHALRNHIESKNPHPKTKEN